MRKNTGNQQDVGLAGGIVIDNEEQAKRALLRRGAREEEDKIDV